MDLDGQTSTASKMFIINPIYITIARRCHFILFSNDFVTIYDGNSMILSPMIGRYCGKWESWELLSASHISSSNELLIHFQTDFSTSTTGFKMEYNSTDSLSVCGPAISCK